MVDDPGLVGSGGLVIPFELGVEVSVSKWSVSVGGRRVEEFVGGFSFQDLEEGQEWAFLESRNFDGLLTFQEGGEVTGGRHLSCSSKTITR